MLAPKAAFDLRPVQRDEDDDDSRIDSLGSHRISHSGRTVRWGRRRMTHDDGNEGRFDHETVHLPEAGHTPISIRVYVHADLPHHDDNLRRQNILAYRHGAHICYAGHTHIAQ